MLNLTRLNFNSPPPYTLWQGRHPLENLFKADFGGLFNVSFSENTIIWSKETYEFGIFNVTGKSSPNDLKLKQTIIIEEFSMKIQMYCCINVKLAIINNL